MVERKMTEVTYEVLMEMAETYLDDEGQVAVSTLVDEGRVYDARLMLLSVISEENDGGRLNGDEFYAEADKIGFDKEYVDRMLEKSAKLFAP